MIKNVFSIFISILILFQIMLPYELRAEDKNLTVDDIRNMSIQNSDGIQNTKIDRIKKQIELKQAQ